MGWGTNPHTHQLKRIYELNHRVRWVKCLVPKQRDKPVGRVTASLTRPTHFSIDIVNQLITINTTTANKKSDGKDNKDDNNDEDNDKTNSEREGKHNNKAKPENKGKNNAKKQGNDEGKGKTSSQTISTTQTSYDDNGNLLKGTTFNNLQWDAENRLIKAEIIPNIEYYSFTYDGLNRRIGAKYTKQGVTSESRYLWCGEQICQKRSATDAVTGRYFDEGEVVVSSGLKAYYARDLLRN